MISDAIKLENFKNRNKKQRLRLVCGKIFRGYIYIYEANLHYDACIKFDFYILLNKKNFSSKEGVFVKVFIIRI